VAQNLTFYDPDLAMWGDPAPPVIIVARNGMNAGQARSCLWPRRAIDGEDLRDAVPHPRVASLGRIFVRTFSARAACLAS
jgi:hypothetical protein